MGIVGGSWPGSRPCRVSKQRVCRGGRRPRSRSFFLVSPIPWKSQRFIDFRLAGAVMLDLELGRNHYSRSELRLARCMTATGGAHHRLPDPGAVGSREQGWRERLHVRTANGRERNSRAITYQFVYYTSRGTESRAVARTEYESGLQRTKADRRLEKASIRLR